jgi:hypothetical protein
MSATATSRRTALCGTITSMTASGRSSADARLLRLYSRLTALEAEFDAVFDRRTTIAEEEATESELDALDRRRTRLLAQIEAAGPPTTMAGVVATARAALAIHHYRDSNGTAIASDDSEWLLLMAAEVLIANA